MFIRSLFRLLIAALALMAIAVLTFLPIMTSSTDLNTILLEDNLSLLNLFNSIKEVFSNNSQAFLVTLFNYSLVIIYMLIPPFILFSIFISALKGIRRKRKRAKVIAKAFFLLYWVMVIYIVRMLINPLTFNIEFAPLIYFMTVFLKSQIDSTVIMLLLGSMLFFIFFELVARALNGKIAYSNSLKSIEKKKADKGVNLTPNNDLVFSGMNNSSLNPSFNQPNIDAVVNPTNTIVYNADSNKTINPQKFEEPLAKQNTVPLQNRVIYQQEAPMWSGLPSSNSSKEAQPQNGVFPNDAIKDDKPISYQNQKDLNQPNQGLGYREPFAKQPSFDQQQQSNFGQPRDTSNNYGAYNSPSNNLNNQGYNRPNQPYYGQRTDTQPSNPYLNQQRDGFNRPNQPYYGQRPDTQPNNPYLNQQRDGFNRPNQPYYGQRPDTQPNNPYLNQQIDGVNRPNQPYNSQNPNYNAPNQYYSTNPNYSKPPYDQATPTGNYNSVPTSNPSNDTKSDPIVQTNTVNCPDCGTIVIKGQKFCSNCGKQMKQNCPQCGTEISSNSKFCSNCGFKVN